MARLSLALLAALAACALGLVTSQHYARKLFAELEREEPRDRGRAASARGEHLGDARARRAARPRAAADAPAGGEADAGARVAARYRRRAPMRFGDSPVLAPTFPPWRARFVVGLLAIAFCSLAGRAA